MTLVSSSIPNFVNGISQQPYSLRLSSQGAEQWNALSTVSSGLRKRPPTEHLARISSTPLTDAFLHLIDRDGTEQYQVFIVNGDLLVYDLFGGRKTVAFTDKAYLGTSLPAGQSFSLTTVADYTFVVNKSVKVLAGTAVAPKRPFESLINVKAGNYGKTYTVLINGQKAATLTTPDGTDAKAESGTFEEILVSTVPPTYTDGPGGESGTRVEIKVPTVPPTYTQFNAGMKAIEQIGTDNVALTLFNQLQAAGYGVSPWSLRRSASTIYLGNSSVDFKLECLDGFSSNGMVAIKGGLAKFSDLPAHPGIDGFTVEITGDQSSSFDNYWVRFDAGGADGNVGVWRETVAPGTVLGLDPKTLPHKLVREADGTFTFKPAEWADRKVGDIKSSPNPSLVGGTINDCFFFQNRLGLLSDENLLMTETGKYFNLFRTTVVSLLDSDPVDVTAATNKVSILRHAVSFNKQLLLFANQQQFVVDSGETMTPKRVPIKPTTAFAVNVGAKPVAAGRNVYFTEDKGSWSGAREFYSDSNSASDDAQSITSHVPSYIPKGIVKIAAGASEDVLAMLSSDSSRLFIYKFYFSGADKMQSSWSEFRFEPGSTILGMDFIRSVLYMVISRPSGVYFERIDFSIGAATAGEPYHVLLDRKVVLPVPALTFDGTYTVIDPAFLGYPPVEPAVGEESGYMVVTHGGGAVKPGQIAPVIVSGSTVKVRGNLTASQLTFGRRYLFRYVVSPLTIKEQSKSGGTQSGTDGRTQVRRIAFNHADTGYYKALVTPEGRQTYSYTFSGKTLGTDTAVVGGIALATGRFNVPVMSRNIGVTIALESDLPLPLSILSADWEAEYVRRARSV